MQIIAKTDIGKKRQENQDNYCYGKVCANTAWAAVCDGMGGANGGAVASEMAAQILKKTFEQDLTPDMDTMLIHRLIEDGILDANVNVLQKARTDQTCVGMGTTAVVAVVQKNYLHLAHVGDSRAYLFRNGRLTQLTKDHSVVQEMVEKGAITQEQAETHPRKNIITRAVGVEARLQAEHSQVALKQGDIILLCSDGLTNQVSKQEMVEILTQTPFAGAVDALVERALYTGGNDNITVLLINVENAEESNG